MSETTTQEAVLTPAAREDVLDLLMKPEVQQSLTVLVENMPKLAEMVTLMTKAYDFVQSVTTDQVLIEDLKGGMDEIVKPITEKAKGIASAAIEASDRAQAETSTIGLFGLLKMLKDPQVQQSLRYAQAFLEVLGERRKQG
ncbi:DUF1641 domain-containing protein [Paenibacillus sp. GYB003]|uniref:DUF1641 domain-containing protein n=1 Tax=Paenibacillus sp. GYB003 TaxID=2994392 RepID=UPI002F9634D5